MNARARRTAATAVLACALVIALHAAALAANIVYGINGTAIYTISPSTGAATAIYTFSPAFSGVTNIAQRPSDGMIFIVTAANVVYRWNPSSPATAPITVGSTGLSTTLDRLAFSAAGVLYAMDQQSKTIWTIDQSSGSATVNGTVSSISGAVGDMAFGADGTLYVSSKDALFSVAPSGGTATSLGKMGLGDSNEGLAFDPSGRLLVSSSGSSSSSIYAVTLPSPTATLIGNVGNSVVLDGMTSIVAPDLTLAKTHAGYFIAQGPAKTYTLQPANAGNAPTSGTITVSDTLPAGLTFVSASGTGWSCAVAAQVVTCTSTTPIPANANGNAISLSVTASSAAVPSVTSTAAISGGNEPAVYAGNNTASDLTYVGGLSIVKTVDLTQPHPGDTVTYTLAYANNNPAGIGSTLQSIVVSDAIPAHMTFFSAACNTPLPATLTSCTVSAPAVGGTGTVSWTMAGALNVGASGSVILKVKVQ